MQFPMRSSTIVLMLSVLWLCWEIKGSHGDTLTNYSSLLWPRNWTERGCALCNCNYTARSVNCSGRDFRNGLPAAHDFPAQDVVVLFELKLGCVGVFYFYLITSTRNGGMKTRVGCVGASSKTNSYLVDMNLTSIPIDIYATLRGNCTVWLNCCKQKTLPRVVDKINVQCMNQGNGVVIEFLGMAAVLTDSQSGFTCYTTERLDDYECVECPKTNTTVSNVMATKLGICKSCPAGGWYQDEVGQKKCKKCVDGTYVPPYKIPGKSPLDCGVCPTGTNTKAHAGFRACPCLDGYYRLDRFGPCMACNATSEGLGCKNDSLSVRSGYWWSWKNSKSTNNQEKFVKFVEELAFEDDSYSIDSVRFDGDLPIVYSCPMEKSCNGGLTDEEMCSKGYAGPLCSLCDNGYFFWSIECVKCPPVWRSVLQLGFIILLFTLFMFALFKVDKIAMNGKRKAATVVDQIAAKVKIIVGFVQVMAGVLSALRYIPWPSLLLAAGAWLKRMELNIVEIAAPSCLSSRLRLNALEKTVINVAGQCVLLLLVCGYYWIRYYVIPYCWPRLRRDERTRSLARRSCMRNSWWILFLCYPSASAQIMATIPYKDWTCHQICHYRDQQDCPLYLKADMSIQCDYTSRDDYKILFVLCWSLSVYVLVLPLLLLFGLYKRHRITKGTPTDNNADDDFISLRDRHGSSKEDMLKSLEFLDENYEQKYWFWELLEIARKFLLTCGIQYFGGGSLSGVAIAAMIANVFLVLHAHFKPIKRKSEQLLQLLSLIVISLSLMLGTLIALQEATSKSTDANDTYDRRVFSVVVMLVNGFFAIYLLGRLVFCGYKALKAVRTNEEGCKFLSWLIYFVTDEDTCSESSVDTTTFEPPVNEMSSFADEMSDDM